MDLNPGSELTPSHLNRPVVGTKVLPCEGQHLLGHGTNVRDCCSDPMSILQSLEIHVSPIW